MDLFYNYKFLDRNVSILTLVGFKQVRLLVTMFPELLKVRSDALLEAQIHKYFLAISAKTGNIYWLLFHQEVDHHQHQAEGFGSTSPFHEKSSLSWSQTRFASWRCIGLLLSNNRDNFLFLARGSYCLLLISMTSTETSGDCGCSTSFTSSSFSASAFISSLTVVK